MNKNIEDIIDDTPKGQDKMKSRLLFLQSYFQRQTDDKHQKTMKELLEVLASEGFKADKRTVKQDIVSLSNSGMDIESRKEGNVYYYYYRGGIFEVAEIKLLIDTIQSSILVTKERSKALIDKLGALVSLNQQEELNRQMYFVDRKNLSDNKQVYYAIDAIYQAINGEKNISFTYKDWTVRNNTVIRTDHKYNGHRYSVSPLALIYNDNKYYMVGYDIDEGKIKNFRIDKIVYAKVLDDGRVHNDIVDNFETLKHTEGLFGMYNGEKETVRIYFPNYLCGTVVDRFGQGLQIIEYDDGGFIVEVEVQLSEQFFAWLCGLGGKVRLLSPEGAVEKIKNFLNTAYAVYDKGN